MPRSAQPRSLRRGIAAVETALVLPMCLLFLFGIFEYGRYVMALQIFTNAAREGTRYALTHIQPVTLNGSTTGNATSDVTNIVNKALAGQTLSSQSTTVYAADSTGNNVGAWTSAQAGQSICVKITGNYLPIMAKYLYMPVSIAVTAQSVMRVENN